MTKTEILEVLDKYEAKSVHSHQDIVWETANESTVYSNSRPYIDFTSGIFVTNGGHSAINKYVMAQAQKGLIYSYCYPTEIKAQFIKKLMKMLPNYLEKVVLSNTGAEAVEIACKLLRLAHIKRGSTGPHIIISIKGSMHGKTFLTEKLRGVSEWALGHDPDFYKISHFPTKKSIFMKDMAVLLGKMSSKYIAGIVLESYRGWNAKFLPINYVKDIFIFAKRCGIPVCFDEVQGGFWRTGKLFAYQNYGEGIKPDLVCLGKGLGGGVPISAVVGRADLIDGAGDLTSTFAGNPLSCAGALGNLTNLEKIDKTRLYLIGEFLKVSLESLKKRHKDKIREVHSKGLLASIVFKDTYTATKCYKKALKKGLLLVYTNKPSVKIGPPLIIDMKELTDGLEILDRTIKEL